jgi:hypothetical protein
MVSKKKLNLVYGITALLLFIAVVSYAAFPVKQPETPYRIVFKTVAGKVLFDHQTHIMPTGYGISCEDCHHHPGGEDVDLRSCGECHLPGEPEALPESCTDCHDADEVEDTEMVNRTDAFHNQCGTCHEEFGAGPAAEECAACHIS